MGTTSRFVPVALGTDRARSLDRREANRHRLVRRFALWAAGVVAATLSGPGLRGAAAETESPPVSEPVGAPQVASRASAPSLLSAHALSQVTDPIATARRAIADCQARHADVRDYTCTFVKRERIGGRLTDPHVMEMKARTHPASIYFRFRAPNQGREAIHVAGRHGGKVLAHDVGIGKFLAGTMTLDPLGSMAMEDCRHPITEAGIGNLIETVAKHWDVELTREESRVSFNPNLRIGAHPCTMIEAVHPSKHPHFLFHMVRIYVSHEHGLPIRYEAFDWPARPGASPELVEEYTYLDVKLNVGLDDRDFDIKNRSYSFGRF